MPPFCHFGAPVIPGVLCCTLRIRYHKAGLIMGFSNAIHFYLPSLNIYYTEKNVSNVSWIFIFGKWGLIRDRGRLCSLLYRIQSLQATQPPMHWKPKEIALPGVN
jgi:hypothetical protein